jgi:adenosine deaminase
MLRKALFFVLLTSSTFCLAQSIEDSFQQLKTDPEGLHAFLKAMPKGGELHYHLDGGVYSETLLELAAKGNYCLDLNSFVMSQNPNKNDSCKDISAAELINDPILYKKTIEAWSMLNFVPGKETSHKHFFNCFGKFQEVVEQNQTGILASIIEKAARSHAHYLEVIMVSSMPNLPSQQATNEALKTRQYAKLRRQLLQNNTFVSEVDAADKKLDAMLPAARKLMGCDITPEAPACQVEVGFQYAVLREFPLDKVFLQTLYAFEAASKSKTIVGVNLVQPEEGHIAVRDYKEHMEIFKFFHHLYPKVHISLHAGELAAGMTSPEALRFHILDAIRVGQAERIGHGVDIDLENNAPALLEYMAEKKIPVEMNLTSNQQNLNISGKQHPLRRYLNNKVPVVLSTDDEGILRTDLTKEYYLAATEQNLSYSELKQISRNALTYSFQNGSSIWLDADKAIVVPQCKDFKSQDCLQFVAKNKKAKLQRALEFKFLDFEKHYTSIGTN